MVGEVWRGLMPVQCVMTSRPLAVMGERKREGRKSQDDQIKRIRTGNADHVKTETALFALLCSPECIRALGKPGDRKITS